MLAGVNLPKIVKNLLIVNIVIFIATQFQTNIGDYLALYYPSHPQFGIWQFISHMFLHAGFVHLLFNMLALVMFGSAIESYLGAQRFLVFYLLCGLGAALLHGLVNYYFINQSLAILRQHGYATSSVLSTVAQSKYDLNWEQFLSSDQLTNLFSYTHAVVGASGAIYGLLVAFAFLYPNAKLVIIFLPIPIKAKYFVPGLILLDLFLGLNGNAIFSGGTSIAHFAHIGGALTALILILCWKRRQTPPSFM